MTDWTSLRGWLYRVVVAAGPIAVFYGLATADEVALWIGFGGTILGVPGGVTALKNFTPSDIVIDDSPGVEEDETAYLDGSAPSAYPSEPRHAE